MKTFKTIFAGSFLFFVLCSNVLGQAIKDPATLPVYKANAPITVDGNLSEADWSTAAPHLMFRLKGTPSGLSYTPTIDTGLVVKPPYTDTSTCYVKFLYYGTKLYVSLKSNDKQVCKFDWEGDGMFMKIKNASNQESEFKLYVINSTTFGAETGGTPIPSAGYGGIGIVNGTILDSANVDNGYTAEGFIDLSTIGFSTVPSSVQVMINIFDPDYYRQGSPTGFAGYGNFAKQWWGSEWGSAYRALSFMPGTSQFDPAAITVYNASGPITVDGNLNEASWAVDVPHLKFRVNGTPSGMSYTPTNSGLIVKPPYTDTSTCYVKFLRVGSKLYFALQSDDKQVCKFDWEGDGMFMKIKNASNQESEFKLYVINSTTFGAETGGTPIPSAGYGGIGIVNGTILDSANVDNGYTAEGFIDLSTIGFSTVPSSVQVMINIFDPDYYRQGSPTGFAGYGNFAKQWWGSEWGSEYRTLNLSTGQVPVELTSFSAAFAADGVTLQWETSTETNNQGFEVQRSADNQSFATVAFVKGHGTTTQKQDYSYIDNTDLTGSIFYRLKQLDFGGNYKYSNTVEVTRAISYELNQNYPNPFNPTTTITYSIPQNSFVTLKIYDILGSEVASLVNGEIEAGVHKLNFNAVGLNSGVYFYTIKAGNFSETKKLMLMK